MAESGGSAKRRQQRDKERAAYMKAQGIERRSGMCPICYGVIANDTFGGFSAASHLGRCTRPSPKYERK